MAAAPKLFKAKDPKDHAYETELVKATKDALIVKGTHRRTGLAREHKLPKALFDSQAYKELVDAQLKLVAQVGEAPFVVALEDEERGGGHLRRAAPQGAGAGAQGGHAVAVQGPRRDEPRAAADTTMDPASRTLAQVTIDDAAALDIEQTFSDLMGDKVEPRKEFIERHAREVRFLDV